MRERMQILDESMCGDSRERRERERKGEIKRAEWVLERTCVDKRKIIKRRIEMW